MEVRLRKFDDELQVVYGEVYAPNVPDSQGDFMTIVEVRKMAHKFLESQRVTKVDTNHDNVENGSCVVESFIARPEDPDFIEESWVVGVHVADGEIWKKVKSGELNGFSFEAMVMSRAKELELEVPEEIVGLTSKAEDHEHEFIVVMDDDGNFVGGRTNIVNGHFHSILKATVTETSMGHAHRYSFVEELIGAES